ncbi:hypothetical protein DBR40_11565 [Pedobacter sp. KBW01]|nr:hypothetical protein DBR40_11565 [Pedobacter sp. KBW01]
MGALFFQIKSIWFYVLLVKSKLEYYLIKKDENCKQKGRKNINKPLFEAFQLKNHENHLVGVHDYLRGKFRILLESFSEI